jgi:hypothetical protein
VVLAMPVVWLNSLAVLAACVPLAFPDRVLALRASRRMADSDASGNRDRLGAAAQAGAGGAE